MPFVDQIVQSLATTGNGTAYDVKGCLQLTLYVTGIGTTSGGSIQWEAAPTKDFSGTWSPIGAAVVASTVNSSKTLFTQALGPHKWVRARITSDITGGGSVNCEIVGI